MSPLPEDGLKRRDLLRAGVATAGAALLTRCTSTTAAATTLEPNARPSLIETLRVTEGVGAKVQRLFPLRGGHHLDPFVLFDHFEVPPTAGFPFHPHRGFEAFGYGFEGMGRHQDNLGNDATVSAGGTMIFTSGKGAWHSEMPVGNGVGRGIQLWVNLPPGKKQMDPGYQAYQAKDVPETHERGVTVRTVAGKGAPTVLQTPMRWLDLQLESGAAFEEAVTAGWTAILYVVQGHVRIGDMEFGQGQAALPQGGAFTVKALMASRVAFITGTPHHQPIRQHGPFVD